MVLHSVSPLQCPATSLPLKIVFNPQKFVLVLLYHGCSRSSSKRACSACALRLNRGEWSKRLLLF